MLVAKRHALALAAPSAPGADRSSWWRLRRASASTGLGCGYIFGPGRLHRSAGLGNAPLIRGVKDALTATGLKLWDVFSYYLRPDFDLDSMLPSFEVGACLGAQYVLVLATTRTCHA